MVKKVGLDVNSQLQRGYASASWLAILAGLTVGWLALSLHFLLRRNRQGATDDATRRFTGSRSRGSGVRDLALRCLSWSTRLSIERKLMHAGLYRWQVADLVLLQVAGALAGGLCGAFAGVRVWLIPLPMMLVAGMIEHWVRQRRHVYSARIAAHLPGFLDMLCLCLSAGMSFNAGLHMVLRYMPDGPLRILWRDWLFDVRAGHTRIEALSRLMSKSVQPSLHRICVVMIQAEKTGAAMAGSLQAQSGHLRQEQLLAAERRAAQAPMRMLLPLILCFFPSTFLVLAFSIWAGVADAF